MSTKEWHHRNRYVKCTCEYVNLKFSSPQTCSTLVFNRRIRYFFGGTSLILISVFAIYSSEYASNRNSSLTNATSASTCQHSPHVFLIFTHSNCIQQGNCKVKPRLDCFRCYCTIHHWCWRAGIFYLSDHARFLAYEQLLTSLFIPLE